MMAVHAKVTVYTNKTVKSFKPVNKETTLAHNLNAHTFVFFILELQIV